MGLLFGGTAVNRRPQGVDVGKSLCEHDMTDTAREIMAKADAAGCAILLPSDVVVAREFKEGAENETVAAGACPADAMILDAGPDTVARIATALEGARTLIWNGPMGAFEIPPFDAATNAAARKAAELTRAGTLTSVAGGGDTVAALNHAGVVDDFHGEWQWRIFMDAMRRAFPDGAVAPLPENHSLMGILFGPLSKNAIFII